MRTKGAYRALIAKTDAEKNPNRKRSNEKDTNHQTESHWNRNRVQKAFRTYMCDLAG